MGNVPVVGEIVKSVDRVVAAVEGGNLCSVENPSSPDCGARCRCNKKAGHDGGHECGKGHRF